MPESTASVTTKFAKGKRGFAAQIIRHIKSAIYCQITAATRALDPTQLQNASGANVNALPKRNSISVKCGSRLCSGKRNGGITIKL